MAKGAKIPDEVRRLIARVYLEHSEWRAKEIQKEVNTRLRKEKPSVHSDWPGLSAIQKELTKYNKKTRERRPDPEDRTWSIITLAKYDIPPKALHKVMEIFADKILTDRVHLTIREAKWIGRLAFVTENNEHLYLAALEYAQAEKIAEITDIDVGDLVDDTLLYEDMRQGTENFLSPEKVQTLRDCIRQELSRHREEQRIKERAREGPDTSLKPTAKELIAEGLELLRKDKGGTK